MYPRILLVCFAFFLHYNISAQSIGGVVNLYAPVTSVGCNYVVATNPVGFLVGDRVLIIQMQGATTASTNNATFGSITAYNNAGNYEFATISSIAGTTIYFQFGLVNLYTPGSQGNVQIIRVPQYSNPTVTSPITALPWNGQIGGVVVMEVSGTLTLNARIDVTGNGFRGGTSCTNPDGGCGAGYTDYFYTVSSGYGAQKGEGISVAVAAMNGGRGAWANGGGGGNKHNTGGGGGSNFSAGGQGGNQANFCPVTPMGGIGGYPLTYNNKIFMGGGGGCSDNNNFVGTPGGNGGGIIIIRAAALAGNNDSIVANGASVGVIPNGIGDGAGGGGAGGTVLLDIGSYTSGVNVKASGGDGGDQNTTYGACFGPGGGGGVGVVWFSQAALPGTVTVITTPGSAGIDITPSSSCYLQSYGAMPGSPGTGQLFNLVMPEGTQPGPTVNLGNDSTLCNGVVTLNAGNPGCTYLWNTGATSQSIVAANGTWWVQVTNAAGCVVSDTITFNGGPAVNLGADTVMCGAGSLLLNAGSGSSYQWSTGSTASSITVTSTGTYSVVVTDAQGCTGTDVITVTFQPAPQVNLGNDSTYCTGVITLNAGNPGATYAWNTGATSQTINVSNGGTYSVVVTYGPGCTASDVITFSSNGPLVMLGPDTSICSSDPLTLNAGPGAASYQWNTGATTQVISVSATGTYSVIVTNSLGCTGNDTINVVFQPAVQVTLGGDIIDCTGGPVVLSATGNASSYLWSDGSQGPSITVGNPGSYWVIGTLGGCTDADTLSVMIEDVAVNFGSDVITCDTIVMLSAGITGASILWSTGQTTTDIFVTTSGTYSVTATTANCTGSDVVNVDFIAGPGNPPVYPNVFTPNNDGTNDFFTPVNYFGGPIDLQIFDRWGNLVFDSGGVNAPWNGTDQDGKDVTEGVYYWIAKYNSGCVVQEIGSQSGFVTILRYRE